MELILADSRNTVSISEKIFSRSFNKALVHQVVTAYLSGSRKGTRAQKSRAEVSGSGKKPWKQKGTGRARSGSIRSPIWRSGGVTFAAKPKKFSQKVNKKMYREALRNIFSELIRANRLVLVQHLFVTSPKTRLLLEQLRHMNLQKVLIITEAIDQNLILASRNTHTVEVRQVDKIDPICLLSFSNVLMTIFSFRKVERMLE